MHPDGRRQKRSSFVNRLSHRGKEYFYQGEKLYGKKQNRYNAVNARKKLLFQKVMVINMDIKPQSKVFTEINIDNLKYNYLAIRDYVNPKSEVMCVVKADGYGHGATVCAKECVKLGATHFGVSSLAEAHEIRCALGDNVEILILGYTPPEETEHLIRENIIQTVFSLEYAKKLSLAAKGVGTVRAHVKLDTGMNRIGFPCSECGLEEVLEAKKLDGINYEGFFTHFATADEQDETFTRLQYEKYIKARDYLKEKGMTFKLHHCCNSAATLSFPEMHLDMVRCGIILYGLSPSKNVKNINLKPVMEFKSVIAHIHTVKAGESISYGATYTASKDIKVATVPAGYADGIPRACSNKACLFVNGKEAKILGNVCMDQCMIDISGIDANVGDDVIIFGESCPDNIESIAKSASTINYELICDVSKRVPRFYLSDK